MKISKNTIQFTLIRVGNIAKQYKIADLAN